MKIEINSDDKLCVIAESIQEMVDLMEYEVKYNNRLNSITTEEDAKIKEWFINQIYNNEI